MLHQQHFTITHVTLSFLLPDVLSHYIKNKHTLLVVNSCKLWLYILQSDYESRFKHNTVLNMKELAEIL